MEKIMGHPGGEAGANAATLKGAATGQGPAFNERYPLHAELKARLGEAQTIGAFLDWLEEQELVICRCRDLGWRGDEYTPDYVSKTNRIGAFLEIDPQALDDEKRAMLDEIRAAALPAPVREAL